MLNNRFQPDLIELEGNNFQRMFPGRTARHAPRHSRQDVHDNTHTQGKPVYVIVDGL
jgi:hypothetical protein